MNSSHAWHELSLAFDGLGLLFAGREPSTPQDFDTLVILHAALGEYLTAKLSTPDTDPAPAPSHVCFACMGQGIVSFDGALRTCLECFGVGGSLVEAAQ